MKLWRRVTERRRARKRLRTWDDAIARAQSNYARGLKAGGEKYWRALERARRSRSSTPLDPADWRVIHDALCFYAGTLESSYGEGSTDAARHARWVRDKSLEHIGP